MTLKLTALVVVSLFYNLFKEKQNFLLTQFRFQEIYIKQRWVSQVF